MNDDDNDSIGFDLAAWEAPRLRAETVTSLADAVIARARQPEARGAVELIDKPRRSWKWIAGGIAFASAAAIAIGVTATRYSSETGGFGAAYADRPTHVELGNGTAADLDPGSTLIWVRDGHRIVALQQHGVATWHVDDKDTARIDAGATVASVVASGASLRVEVDMNFSDAKTMGVTAVGSATIATLVTVLVYNGHAQVSGNDHAMTVTPGSTVAVHAGAPPTDKEKRDSMKHAFDDLEAKAKVLTLEEKLADKDRVIAELEASVRKLGGPASVTVGCDYDAAIKRGDTLIMSGSNAAALASYSLALKCKPNDQQAARKGYLSACRSKNFVEAKKLFVTIGSPMSLAQICMKEGYDPRSSSPVTVAPKPPVTPVAPEPAAVSCDDKAKVATIIKQGDDLVQSGSFGAALDKFEQVVKCNPGLHSKMYLSACRAKNFAKAKDYFELLGSPRGLAQICVKEGYDPLSPPPQ